MNVGATQNDRRGLFGREKREDLVTIIICERLPAQFKSNFRKALGEFGMGSALLLLFSSLRPVFMLDFLCGESNHGPLLGAGQGWRSGTSPTKVLDDALEKVTIWEYYATPWGSTELTCSNVQ